MACWVVVSHFFINLRCLKVTFTYAIYHFRQGQLAFGHVALLDHAIFNSMRRARRLIGRNGGASPA